MRKNYLRNNYLGLLGYTIVLLGIVSGGVWLVILATANSASALVPGILALVLLVCGGAMLAVMAIWGRQDPLEPAAVDVNTILDEDEGEDKDEDEGEEEDEDKDQDEGDVDGRSGQ